MELLLRLLLELFLDNLCRMGFDIHDGETYCIGSSSAALGFTITFSGCASASFSPTLSGPGGIYLFCSGLDLS